MHRIIRKIIIFISPWAFLFIFNYYNLEFDSGDLLRLSYSYKSFKNKTIKNFPTSNKKHSNIINCNSQKKKGIDILSIGDSFSDIEYSYTDFLTDFGHKVVHIGRTDGINSNPFQKCVDIINLGILDEFNPKIVLIESVERSLLDRINEINYLSVPRKSTYFKNETNQTTPKILDKQKTEFNDYVLRSILKAPKTQFYFNIIEKKPNDIPVHFTKLKNQNQFYPENNTLLFYHDDLVEFKFDSTLIKHTIKSIEKFDDFCIEHHVKVYYIVAPDKYDVYFDEIVNSQRYKKSLFSQFWNENNSNLNIIDAYKIIKQLKKKNFSNLYYYGDTHWTSIVTEKIAEEINTKLKN